MFSFFYWAFLSIYFNTNYINKIAGSKKKKHKSKVGSLDVSALVGIIIAAIVVTIIIICVIYFLYLKHKTKKAESLGQGNYLYYHHLCYYLLTNQLLIHLFVLTKCYRENKWIIEKSDI